MSVLRTYGEGASYKTSRTFRINNNRIVGIIDNLDAVKQSAMLMLSVERFEHLIYSLDYGGEFSSLIGKQREYVESEIKRRIKECLKQDDRIEDIKEFSMVHEGERLNVKLTIVSSFGDIEIERMY